MTAHEVARYFVSLVDEEAGDSITNLKLQKLLYYAQGVNLANCTTTKRSDMKKRVLAILGVAAVFAVSSSTSALAQYLPVEQDTYFTSGNGTNFGTATTVYVDGASMSEGLIQFDLTQLPAGTTASMIQQATLTIFVDHVNNSGTINIDTASGAWTESSVNGTNAPAPSSAVATAVPVSTLNDYLSVDATAAVQGWISGTANNGFLIIPNGNVSFQFDSKENTNTSHPAFLSIVLSGTAGPAGPAGPTGPTGPAGPTGAQGPAGATSFVTVVANYSKPGIDLSCPSGYGVVLAICGTAIGGAGLVLNDQNTPRLPGLSVGWQNYLIPSANAATGVHCSSDVTFVQQAQLRCSQ
jgi:hypothetical protein